MAENRLKRDKETRETETRTKMWQRPETLPTPDEEPGYKFRWIRTSTLGNLDPSNISSKFREGWEPVKAEDYPEMNVLSDGVHERFKDNIVVGGLILCKTPTEVVEQRNAYYKNQTQQQMRSVDNSLMRENDPRMPLFNDRKSTVSFGKGS